MPDDNERLIVSMEARIRDFERNMQKAERTGTRSFQQLRSGSSRATRQMETDMTRSTARINEALATTSARIGSFGKAFAGGLAVGAAVGALEGIRQAAVEGTKSVLEMSDQAKRAGVSFKAFQELKFVSEQNRIEVDSLTDGLKELSLRADEFIKTGAGSSAEAFQRLGYDAQTLAKKLKEPDQLFLEIIGKLQRMDRAAQIRIADEVFGGTGGEKFVQLISKGETGLRGQIKAANDLGLVMDDQMVAKAEMVNQKFNAIATTISTTVKGAIVEAVAAWLDFINSATAPSIAVDPNDRVAAARKLQAIENDTTMNSRAKAAALGAQRRELARIDRERATVAQERQAIEQRIAEIEADQSMNSRAKAAALGEQRRELAKLADIQTQMVKEATGPQVQGNRTITPAADQADRQAALEKQRFLDGRNTEARKTEIDRQIDERADAILKAAQAVGVSLDKAAAVIQAKSEIAVQQSAASTASAAELIKGFESFSAKPYWDVNALRAGFGSDTVTLSDNSVQRVTSGITVSLADANRDLERRIGEFQKGIEGKIGADTFRSMTENQQASLTSIAYNYGELPDRIVAALKGGDAGTVSEAIRGLGSDNDGINKKRRGQEADLYLSDAPQGVQDRVSDMRDRSEAYADLIAKSKEFVAGQQLEHDTLGIASQAAAALRYEQEMLNEARQAGIDLSPEQIEGIKNAAGAMAEYEQRSKSAARSQEELAQAAQEFANLGKDVTKGFITDLRDGATAADAFKNALMKIADALLDQVLNAIFQVNSAGGTGGGGGFWSAIVGAFTGGGASADPWAGMRTAGASLPKFAKGGIARSPSIFGDAGAEAAVPLPDGRRIPVDLKVPNNSSSSAPSSISVRGGDVIVQGDVSEKNLRAIREAIEKNNRNLPDMIETHRRNPHKRGAL